MIAIKQASKESINILNEICSNADEKLFYDNNVYLFFENNIPAAYSACAMREAYIEITALQVKQDYANNGYDKILLQHMEDKYYGDENIFIINILINQSEAIKFYKSNGYNELTKEQAEKLKLSGVSFNNLYMSLYKAVQKRTTKCSCCQ